MPIAHPGMYRAWKTVSPATTGICTPPRTNTPKIHSAYHINNINNTALQTIIDIQFKQDATEQLQRVDINDSHHSMAVIVTKKWNKKGANSIPTCNLHVTNQVYLHKSDQEQQFYYLAGTHNRADNQASPTKYSYGTRAHASRKKNLQSTKTQQSAKISTDADAMLDLFPASPTPTSKAMKFPTLS